MRPFTTTLKALSLSVGILFPSAAVADGNFQQYGISGVVSHVDREGIIQLEDGVNHGPGIPVRQSYAVRQWALKVNPAALAVVVDGRRISCVFVYELEDYIVANCEVHFNRRTAFEGVASTPPIIEIVRNLNIGQIVCSNEDRNALAADPSLRSPWISRSDCMNEAYDEL